MKNSIIHISVHDVKAQTTAHQIGKKHVLASGNDCESSITQVAKGILEINEVIEPHQHPTMEEFYFFLSGEAEMWINNSLYKCVANTFLKIPANQTHFIKPITKVEFLYWGVAI